MKPTIAPAPTPDADSVLDDYEKVLIAGYFGYGNTGDEAILAGMLALLRHCRPDLSFSVLSGDPPRTCREHAVESIAWTDLPAIAREVERSDLVLLGGGGLFHDLGGADFESLLSSSYVGLTGYAGVALMAALNGRPCMIYAVGVGPLETETGKELTRVAFEAAGAASVRDRPSLELLWRLGVEVDRVSLAADPAYGLAADRATAAAVLERAGVDRQKPILGVCLRSWGREDQAPAWHAAVASALDGLIQTDGFVPVFIPFQRSSTEGLLDDRRAIAGVRSRMVEKEATTVIPGEHAPEVVSGLVAHCDLLLGMRLHALIFAAQHGIAAAGLAYDPKVEHHMSALGAPELALDLERLTPERIADALQGARRWGTAKAGDLQAWAASRQELVQSDAEKALALLEGQTPARERAIEPHFLMRFSHKQTQNLLRLMDQNERLMADLARTQEQLRREQEALAALRDSFGMMLLQDVRRVLNRLAPSNTRRARALSVLISKARRARTRGVLSGLVPAGVRRRAGELRRSLRARRQRGLVARYQPDLKQILAEHTDVRRVILFPPGLDWKVQLFQRPQQLATALARQGALVFYIEPETSGRSPGFHRVEPRLFLSKVPNRVFEIVDRPLIYLLTWNRGHLDDFPEARVLYDFVDDLQVFYVDDFETLQRDHERLLRESELVLTTAKRLHQQVLRVRQDAVLCPNAVDYEHFQAASERHGGSPPSDMAGIVSLGKPIVGYYGALARWFDYALLAEVASHRSDLAFVLIGPDYDGSMRSEALFQLPNVRWLGVKPYSDLPAYLRWFDVAMIPFKLNEITHATSPLKLFEYMAGGKPVVITPMQESARYEGVLLAGDPRQMSERLDEALELGRDQGYVRKIQAVARRNTWSARAEQILDRLDPE